MNLLKQFSLGQRRASAFATQNKVQLDDIKTIAMINRLVLMVETLGWNEEAQSHLSMVVLQTAHRYYAFADRLLNRCQKEESGAFDKAHIVAKLRKLEDTLLFYTTVSITTELPENELKSVEQITNELFAMMAVNFKNSLLGDIPFEVRWQENLSAMSVFSRDCTAYEPVYSATHEEFMKGVDQTQCIFAPTGKYWGADDWDETRSFNENVSVFAKGYFRFMALSKKEKFKGFAVRFPASYSATLTDLAKTVADFLFALNAIDPAKSTCMVQNIEDENWTFDWANESLFLTAFGTCYPEKHARNPYGFDYTYFFFQPDFVLRNHPGLTGGKEQQSRERILSNFSKNGMAYDNLGKERLAQRYIRPMEALDPAVKWWDYVARSTG